MLIITPVSMLTKLLITELIPIEIKLSGLIEANLLTEDVGSIIFKKVM